MAYVVAMLSVREGLFAGVMSEQKHLVSLASLSLVWQPQCCLSDLLHGSSGDLQHLPYEHIESCCHSSIGCLRMGDPYFALISQ